MAIWRFILGNLRKRKSYSIVICILIFLAGLILSVSVSTIKNAGTAYDTALDRVKGPHIQYWISGNAYKSEQLAWFKNRSEVESAVVKKAFTYNGAYFEGNGTNYFGSGDIVLHRFEASERDTVQIIDGTNRLLKSGEIYLPYIAKTNFGLATGDRLDFVFGKSRIPLRIGGFYEDPVYGGAMIDVKSIYFSNQDIDKILSMDKTYYRATFLQVRLVELTPDNITKLNGEFMKQYNNSIGYVNLYYSQKSYHLILPQIALAVMVVFAALLFFITLTIIRYAILATIEADFVNIGIVKALGFTPRMVQLTITGQYGLLAAVSAMASFVAGIFMTPFVGKVILKSSGLNLNGNMAFGVVILFLVGLTMLIVLFAFVTSKRTNRISPVRAISQGMAPNHYSTVMNVSLEKLSFLPFDLRMALKQILTKVKRYFLLVIICSLLSLALVLLLGVSSYLKTDQAVQMLGIPLSDIELDVKDKATGLRLISEIEKDYKISECYFENGRQVLIRDEKAVVKISDSYDGARMAAPLEGRYPLHDNEIAISLLDQQKYKCNVGDPLLLRGKDGKDYKFLITGIFQAVREGGYLSFIVESGMKRLDPTFELSEVYFRLDTHENLDKVIEQMKNRYTGYIELSNQYMQTIEQVNSVRTVFDAVTKLVFGLTIIMIGVITLLIMKVTVFSELKELGIYKAVGFDSSRLRRQLAVRLLLVSLFGSMIGVGVEAFAGSWLMSLSLGTAGISRVSLTFSPLNSAIAVITIAILSLASAYLASHNVKSVTAYMLINE